MIMAGLKSFFTKSLFFNDLKGKDHFRISGAGDILKYIGPGLLVAVVFTGTIRLAADISMA
jgi:hypothetical protein